MKQTIENNVVSISIGTAITVLTSVMIMVWNVANMRAEFKDTNAQFNTRLTVMETKNKTEQAYFDNSIKSLKGDIEKNNKKLNDIYNLLIKGR